MKLTELVGNTPLVELARMANKSSVRILAKLEGQTPAAA